MNIKIILILLLSITCSAINARKITIYNKSQKTLEVIIIPAEVRHLLYPFIAKGSSSLTGQTSGFPKNI